MNNKEDNFKEKFKQVLISTAKVISDDYKLDLNHQSKHSRSYVVRFQKKEYFLRQCLGVIFRG